MGRVGYPSQRNTEGAPRRTFLSGTSPRPSGPCRLWLAKPSLEQNGRGCCPVLLADLHVRRFFAWLLWTVSLKPEEPDQQAGGAGADIQRTPLQTGRDCFTGSHKLPAGKAAAQSQAFPHSHLHQMPREIPTPGWRPLGVSRTSPDPLAAAGAEAGGAGAGRCWSGRVQRI